jgi:hypothetical protein
MSYQNPKPRTAAELSAMMDERNELSGTTVIHKAPNAKCMEGFCPRTEAIRMEADICNID